MTLTSGASTINWTLVPFAIQPTIVDWAPSGGLWVAAYTLAREWANKLILMVGPGCMRIRMRLPIKSWLEKCQVRGECSARGVTSLVRRDFEAPLRLLRTGTVTALNADTTSRARTDARLSLRLAQYLGVDRFRNTLRD